MTRPLQGEATPAQSHEIISRELETTLLDLDKVSFPGKEKNLRMTS